MGTDKRERQKINRQKKLESEAKAENRDNLRQRVITGLVIAAAVALVIFWLSRGGDDDTDTAASTTDDAATTTVPGSEEPTTEPAVVSEVDCPAADGSSPQVLEFDAAPPMCIDAAKTYTAEMVTSEGTITVELDAAKAPTTVNNFVFLARNHYYDGATFHRVIGEFMIQGGDAVGEPRGTGNPGYAIDDELPEAGEYEVGSIAMANSGPNTNGSQFFIVTGDSGVALPPLYSLFGKVSDGMDAVTAIEAVETGTQDAPVTDVVIESVTITES